VRCCVGSRFTTTPPVTTFRATHRSCLCITSLTTCVAAWAADLLQRHQLQHPGPHIVLASVQHHSPCALLRGQPNYYNTTSYSIQDHTSFLPLYHFTHHVCCCVGSRFAMAPPVTTFRATHRSCLCTTSFTTCVAAWAADLLQRHQLQHPGPHIVLASI